MSQKPKVVVIDDDDSVMRVFCLLLERIGCETKMALNAESALKIYKKELLESDVVFLDLGIPGENFYKSAKQLFELRKDIKIIAITGALYKEDEEKMKDIGIYKSVSKPVSMDDLKKIIEGLTL